MCALTLSFSDIIVFDAFFASRSVVLKNKKINLINHILQNKIICSVKLALKIKTIKNNELQMAF